MRVLRYFPYRTARVQGLYSREKKPLPALEILCPPKGSTRVIYDRDRTTDQLQRELSTLAGRHSPDNHEVYEVEIRGNTLYLLFSDWTVTVASSVEECNW